MYERFTDRARKVLQLAQQEARRLNHEYIGTVHLLLGLISRKGDIGHGIIAIINSGVALDDIRREVEKLVLIAPAWSNWGKLPQTPRTKRVLTYAMEESRDLGHKYVGTEHLLLGLLRESGGIAGLLLINLGLELENVRQEVLNLLGTGEQTPPVSHGVYKQLIQRSMPEGLSSDEQGVWLNRYLQRRDDDDAGKRIQVERLERTIAELGEYARDLPGGSGRTAFEALVAAATSGRK
ncbi:hypothetical protein LCGC14_0428770 [marine sediment metagenome]|uniref:Clp R domain-containing protein n=1 Tax=marine sediment metagenome TaxID=412755 RepID=A0A0F9SUN2_9ZZZZ